jgi:hypothetical protein
MFIAARSSFISSLKRIRLNNKNTNLQILFPKFRNTTIMKKFLNLIISVFLFASFAQAQTAEVAVSLNERFFETLLDAIFKNFNAPEFPLANNSSTLKIQSPKSLVSSFRENESKIENQKSKVINCNETIRLQREIGGVRTAVKFRDGKIYTPIAFIGSYNPPLIGCIDFQGWAETNVNLEYDKQNQKLFGRVQVLNVQLSGAGGIGSNLLSKLVQSAIDKKVNPIEILNADKLSLLIPLQNSGGSLKMKAVGIRSEISNNVLNVHVAYEFSKAN